MGGRYSNCSILEALNIIEDISKVKIKRKILKANRIGDHIWYISNLEKFKKHYLIGNSHTQQKNNQ